MGTVNNNFAVLQRGSFYTGDFWDERQYDEYEWRDYFRDNINSDGRSRYQLWKKSGRGDWRREGEYKTNEMEADLERLRSEYKAAEERREAAERREREKEQEARAASRASWEGNGRNGRRWD